MSGVLFLDIEGVLNSRECWVRLRDQRHKIDREKVGLLNEVVRITGCRLVISSTWRKGIGQGQGGCRHILRDYGLKARFRRDWRTPEFSTDDPTAPVRGTEIADWLSRNGSPPYAIVDDDSDMLPEQMPRFVQTSFEHGLTRTHADRLIALLSPTPAGRSGSSSIAEAEE
ncbi:HAD domain-containing protein [Methylobacterium organophilum]|uniref:Polynucleotide kinase n=1 Tax=Methylobacterium organophilum TaxID=410 RepID=A0ABQ4T6U4_METOR|nr:HAD domain-containing protein [Methylobacterium organophilum]GJE26269.1 hypothetical protein LKMONMHP_1118 [Methylobacterium organophilum]